MNQKSITFVLEIKNKKQYDKNRTNYRTVA